MENDMAPLRSDTIALPPMPVVLGMAAVLALLLSLVYTAFKFQLW
jgi:hypothetical protein